MIRSFGDAATAEIYRGEDTRRARSIPKRLWPVVRRKLDAIHRARSLNDLRWPAGNRLETLRGDRAGTISIRVNDPYRVTFRLEEGHAYDVTCEDYH